jgi:purine nucleoside phosphorylase
MLAIIGGTGLTQLTNLKITHRQVMRTPYGEPSGPLTFGTLNQSEVMFLARHGYGHTIPPHVVNYRANLWALREQGATRVISVASVGGIRADLVPGTLVPDQIATTPMVAISLLRRQDHPLRTSISPVRTATNCASRYWLRPSWRRRPVSMAVSMP